jgi:hypothetical protein
VLQALKIQSNLASKPVLHDWLLEWRALLSTRVRFETVSKMEKRQSGSKKRKVRMRWWTVFPLHILIFALAVSLAQPLKKCTMEIGSVVKKVSEEAEHFMMDHPLEFDTLENFRSSRTRWHTEFDILLRDVSKGYRSVILDEGYDGYCSAKYPIMVLMIDCMALLVLVMTAGYFLYQDATTSFGASGQEVFTVLNMLIPFFIVLGILTFPSLHLMRLAVKLSAKLEDCTKDLKEAQRSIVAGFGYL